MYQFNIVPESWIGRVASWCLSPVMRCLSGALGESPQVTHFWNNRVLTQDEFAMLEDTLFTSEVADDTAVVRRSRFDVRFHLPVAGGWTKYVVVRPRTGQIIDGHWFIGWDTGISGGVSLVPIRGPRVRVLLSSTKTAFFGLDRNGTQIPVEIAGYGAIGDGAKPFGRLPLH